MKNFKEVKECPKCGVNLFESVEDVFLGRRIHVPSLEIAPDIYLPEHLKVSCHSCGYIWSEYCKDNKEDN